MPEKPCGAIAELEPGPTLLRECRWPFTFQRTLDTDLIRSVITHPRIWPAISDDFIGKSEDFQPSTEPSTWYIAVREGETLLGLFILTRQTGVCAELHTCLLPIACDAAQRLADNYSTGYGRTRYVSASSPTCRSSTAWHFGPASESE